MRFGRFPLPVAVLVGWVLLAALSELLVPRLIRDAYRGQSIPVLNRMISGQHELSPEHYVQRWRALARPALAAVGVASLLAILLFLPLPQPLASLLVLPDAKETPDPVLPEPRRRRLIHAGVFVLVAGSAIEIATDPPYSREHWPFSQYQMYSELQKDPTIVAVRLFGVTADASNTEIALVEPKYIRPFDHPRLWVSLRWMNRDPDRERLLRAALGDCLRRYEDRRRAGLHDGPRLQSVRLYLVCWHLDPWARNQDSPTSRELLYEVLPSNSATAPS